MVNRRTFPAIGAFTAATASVFLGFVVASKAVAPPTTRRPNVRIYGTTTRATKPCVVLKRSARTESPGEFSLWFGDGHAHLGAIVDETPTTVTREIIRVDRGDLASAVAGSWSGYAHILASTLGLSSTEVDIPTRFGPAPAWKIDAPSGSQGSEWAIHVHGFGSSRAGMLRGVKVAAGAGMTSLVVSYRNDGEGPATEHGKSTLGLDETEDVEQAISYALEKGARSIVLFGWSMGAAIALNLTMESAHPDVIAGVVAISPVLDWSQTLRSNCRRAGLPAFIGSLAAGLFSTRIGSSLLRLPHPLALHNLDWVKRANELSHPILITHGTKDTSVPLASSTRLATLRPDLVSLVEFDSEHTLEWNSDPEAWEAAVSSWLERLHQRGDLYRDPEGRARKRK